LHRNALLFFTMPKLILHNHPWHKTCHKLFSIISQWIKKLFASFKQHFIVDYHESQSIAKDLIFKMRKDFKLEVLKLAHFHILTSPTQLLTIHGQHTTRSPSLVHPTHRPTHLSLATPLLPHTHKILSVGDALSLSLFSPSYTLQT